MTGHRSWTNKVTEEESHEQPKEAKGAILADDVCQMFIFALRSFPLSNSNNLFADSHLLQMGLGKTITCVSLIAATLQSARDFAAQPLDPPASHFAGSVFGMPHTSSKGKKTKKADREQEKTGVEYVRACRIKTRSRATLIVCPLSTVANWEEQFREHWRGEVTVVGGSGIAVSAAAAAASSSTNLPDSTSTGVSTASEALTSNYTMSISTAHMSTKPEKSVRDNTPLRVYIYHGNARRPDPEFLAGFDAVITTYATLASEFSKQNKSAQIQGEDDDGGSSDGEMDSGKLGEDEDLEIVELHTNGMSLEATKHATKKTGGTKRKKPMATVSSTEISSPLQSINWFRVVLDEAQYALFSLFYYGQIAHACLPFSSIKEIQTVGCRASCDLVADRRLCLTGTPVQNKLDDMFALIKFLRLTPLDDKNLWTKFISSPAKYGQPEGIFRLRTVMNTITLRRTKETRSPDGNRILALPPREDKLVRLEMSPIESRIYRHYYTESKAEFTDLSRKNQVMKNYVGILQKLLRLRQICDHQDLIQTHQMKPDGDVGMSYTEEIAKEGISRERAGAIFAILREAMTTQCTECGRELNGMAEGPGAHGADITMDPSSSMSSAMDRPAPNKRGRKSKAQISRVPTRASSPSLNTISSSGPRPILTRCRHLFCLECFRALIYPGWPDVHPGPTRPCSACQFELGPADAVEIKPDMIVDTSTVGVDGKDGKKIKKETKEDRIKKLERRVREVELIFIQRQQQLQRQAYVSLHPTSGPSQLRYGFEQQTDPRQFDGREMDVKNIKIEEEIGGALKREMDFTSVLEQFKQRNGCELDSGSRPPFFTQSPLCFDGDATSIAAGSDRFCPESFKEDEKLDINALSDLSFFSNASSLLPPPLHPHPQPLLGNVDFREQAVLYVQREICERSTKIKALIQRLMPLSMENPHSENYNPAGLDLQIVDRNGKGSEDNVIKTVVL